MRPVSFSILMIFIMIPILAVLSYQQFKSAFNFNLEANLGASLINLPKIDKVGENLRVGQNTKYLDFTDPYGKLKIRYGTSWIKADDNVIAEVKNLSQSDKRELLFFLYKIDLANFFPSYLVVERIKMGKWEDIMGSLQQDAEDSNQIMEIVKSSLAENRVSLEIKYTQKAPQTSKTSLPAHQREEILLDGDESYMVSVMTTEQNWPLIQPEIEEIIKSVEFLGAPLKATTDNTSNPNNDNTSNNKTVGAPMPESDK